jgi:hypothetical protein
MARSAAMKNVCSTVRLNLSKSYAQNQISLNESAQHMATQIMCLYFRAVPCHQSLTQR